MCAEHHVRMVTGHGFPQVGSINSVHNRVRAVMPDRVTDMECAGEDTGDDPAEGRGGWAGAIGVSHTAENPATRLQCSQPSISTHLFLAEGLNDSDDPRIPPRFGSWLRNTKPEEA